MDIAFECGYYVLGRLCKFSACLNANEDYYTKLKEVLQIQKIKDIPYVRVGLPNKDGGYIMLNDVSFSGNIAYSFGISNDVSWDNVMAELGYDIFMYDHTIEKLPYERKEFHFNKQGISGRNEKGGILNTLKYYITRNGHEDKNNMILKMDVEGAEWDFLETVDTKTLQKFNQIVFEFHNVVRAGYGERILKLLAKLNKTHQLIHLHGNNSGLIVKIGNSVFPDVLEATYVLKEKYEFIEDKELSLPRPDDAPNDIGRPDIILGKWNYPFISE